MLEVTKQWLTSTAQAAGAANHIWPEMAACEAGLESAFGTSKLAAQDNNLFGMKTHAHEVYGVVVLPTKEYLDGNWEVVDASFVKYATLEECFEDRMDTLYRLKSVYPYYSAALSAQDEFTYINEVSRTWSTDPNRASKVTTIYKEYFQSTNNSEQVQDAADGSN
jgi:flagellum-specific peptidoglycan hydrolase FlgJ